MAENTKISWTDHTFNPWSGCQKVSPGCQHCYAEAQAKRNPATLGVWGPTGTRVRMGDAYWRKPLRWNERAAIWAECPTCHWRGFSDWGGGKFAPHCAACFKRDVVSVLEHSRQRVFCASMADVFEDRPELVAWRADLFRLIVDTPNLDWLLLTKRPENINRMMTQAADLLLRINQKAAVAWGRWVVHGLPYALPNVWIGTTVENQEQADKRIPALLGVPVAVRFLSCEPMLSAVDLERIPDALYGKVWPDTTRGRGGIGGQVITADPGLVHWVICGGESGHGARYMDAHWALSLKEQCEAAGVPFFMKQMGAVWADEVGSSDKKGGDLSEMPVELRVRQFPK